MYVHTIRKCIAVSRIQARKTTGMKAKWDYSYASPKKEKLMQDERTKYNVPCLRVLQAVSS
jgi:hypothetical protein